MDGMALEQQGVNQHIHHKAKDAQGKSHPIDVGQNHQGADEQDQSNAYHLHFGDAVVYQHTVLGARHQAIDVTFVIIIEHTS